MLRLFGYCEAEMETMGMLELDDDGDDGDNPRGPRIMRLYDCGISVARRPTRDECGTRSCS